MTLETLRLERVIVFAISVYVNGGNGVELHEKSGTYGYGNMVHLMEELDIPGLVRIEMQVV